MAWTGKRALALDEQTGHVCADCAATNRLINKEVNMDMSISNSPAIITKIKIKPLLAYLVPVLAISPSLVWIALDKTVWSWDQAWYGKISVELFYTLVISLSNWVLMMLNSLPSKAPGITWIGQFFVPLGYLMGSIDMGLLFSILVTQALGLMLMYRSILELSKEKLLVAIMGCLVIASAPLFVGLSHYYLVEPMQTLAVAWFVLIMSFASRWSRAFILSQLFAATSFAMLAKASSPLYCLGPGLVALGYAFQPKSLQRRSEWRQKHVVVTLAFGILLGFAATAWYYRNVEYVIQHVSMASSGPIAELFGKEDTFLNTIMYWLGATQRSFFLPSVLLLASLIFVSRVVCYFIKHDTLTRHFTLCGVTALVQIIAALAVFSLSSCRVPRYLLPLLPYFAILICWGVAQINKPILTSLMIVVFTAQLAIIHGQALSIIQQDLSVPWLVPANSDTRNATLLNSIVSRTCKASTERYWNIIGVEQPWLSFSSVSYVAAKNLAPHDLSCYYDSLGYFLESDPDKVWRRILSLRIRYYITVDPDLYPVPPDALSQRINLLNSPILKKVQTSGLFEPEPPLSDDPGILIFRSIEVNPSFSFGNIATLLDYDLSGDLLLDSARVQVRLQWQALQPIVQPYTVSLRVVDSNGLILAESESQTPGDATSTTERQAGEIVTGTYEINITGSKPALANLEIRLLDAAGQSVPLQNGLEAIIISNVQNEVSWRTLDQ